ncbi:kinase-like domain-containing protein [Trametes gibbosa]|nr:kinase-like domain-containing protein [Trametes gibbosa]
MDTHWQEHDPIEFHFDPMDTTEELELYRPGGYHPVAIGDMLDAQPDLPAPQRRYRILHKLGYGAYATVWLARDVRSATFVALKITTADLGAHAAREAQMLARLAGARRGDSDGAPSHILEIYDHFSIRGPNGTHHVLVTEVVVPALSSLNPSKPPGWRKALARGLVRGVAQMHDSGAKHGDIHLGNLGCAFPELAGQDESNVMQDLSPYDVTIVLPCDPVAQTASLPPYVVAPCALAQYMKQIRAPDSAPHPKLLDYGNARGTDEPAGDIQCAAEACAPEVAFALVALGRRDPGWGPESDVWAVGAAMYELVAGSSIFHGVGISDGLLRAMAVMAGGVLPEWQAYWESRPSLQSAELSLEDAETKWQERREHLRRGCEDDADADRLVRLLRRILVLDPGKRPTIHEVLHDPWFDMELSQCCCCTQSHERYSYEATQHPDGAIHSSAAVFYRRLETPNTYPECASVAWIPGTPLVWREVAMRLPSGEVPGPRLYHFPPKISSYSSLHYEIELVRTNSPVSCVIFIIGYRGVVPVPVVCEKRVGSPFQQRELYSAGKPVLSCPTAITDDAVKSMFIWLCIQPSHVVSHLR